MDLNILENELNKMINNEKLYQRACLVIFITSICNFFIFKSIYLILTISASISLIVFFSQLYKCTFLKKIKTEYPNEFNKHITSFEKYTKVEMIFMVILAFIFIAIIWFNVLSDRDTGEFIFSFFFSLLLLTLLIVFYIFSYKEKIKNIKNLKRETTL